MAYFTSLDIFFLLFFPYFAYIISSSILIKDKPTITMAYIATFIHKPCTLRVSNIACGLPHSHVQSAAHFLFQSNSWPFHVNN